MRQRKDYFGYNKSLQGVIIMKKDEIKEEIILKSIFDFAPDAIIIVNSESLILHVNSQAEKIFAYIEKELIGKSVEILIPERFRKSHREHMKEYFKKPRIRFMGSELNLYGLRKDGTEFPVDISLSYIETQSEIVVISIIRDLTDHKRMEEALSVSEAKYRSIFENAAEGIFQTSFDGHIISANPSCVRILGYDSVEELLKTITDVRKLYAEPGRRLHLIRSIRADGAVSDFEALIYRKDKSKIWVSINAHALKGQDDKMVGIEGMILDITGRKRAEKNFRMLVDGAPDAIIAIERNFNIIIMNTHAERLFGYSKLELIGNPYNILVPERFMNKHADYCRKYFEYPSTRIMALHMDSVAKHRDGNEFPVEIYMSPVETDEGIVIVIDIRDLKEKKK